MDWSADMKEILKTCATAMTKIRGSWERNNRLIAAASFICLAFGLALSHRIEPGVRVQKVTLAEETPALKFIPAGAGTASGGTARPRIRQLERDALSLRGGASQPPDLFATTLTNRGTERRRGHILLWKPCIRWRRSHARSGR